MQAGPADDDVIDLSALPSPRASGAYSRGWNAQLTFQEKLRFLL